MQKTSQNLQIILTSPTIPKKMQDFASNFMKNPIFISHNRSSLLKLPIMQHSVWATEENKLVKLLEALIKTDPPVLVFCENKNESDKLEDYLNIRKIKCASLHGGKSQNSRSRAIQDFNRKKVDVLIATDIAAKGLGFRDVKHIVNFDLPKDIDSYIQRVCRAGAKAVISNLISNRVDKVFLKDLTAFLKAMGDKVPQFLSEFLELIESNCEICNSPGHLKMFCTVFQQDSLKYELPLSKVSLK
jgi:ATP-dependent RNA helicase DDX41